MSTYITAWIHCWLKSSSKVFEDHAKFNISRCLKLTLYKIKILLCPNNEKFPSWFILYLRKHETGASQKGMYNSNEKHWINLRQFQSWYFFFHLNVFCTIQTTRLYHTNIFFISQHNERSKKFINTITFR